MTTSLTRSVLALDLGTSTGWAVCHRGGMIASGSHCLRGGRHEGGGMRYLRLGRWLDEICLLAGGIDEVWYEEVRRHAGTDAAHVYGGCLATLTAWCEQHEIPYAGVPVASIKKHATGKGNGSKEAVISAMRERGHEPHGDDEADALALLYCVLDQTGRTLDERIG